MKSRFSNPPPTPPREHTGVQGAARVFSWWEGFGVGWRQGKVAESSEPAARPRKTKAPRNLELARCSRELTDLLRSPRDTRQRPVASPSPLNGERMLRNRISRVEPLNLVGTRSTASPFLRQQSGTQWNASLPVPEGRFMERAGVRGENIENSPISRADSADDHPHLTLPSPLPPGAEREDRCTSVTYPTACAVRRSSFLTMGFAPDPGSSPRLTRIPRLAGLAGDHFRLRLCSSPGEQTIGREVHPSLSADPVIRVARGEPEAAGLRARAAAPAGTGRAQQ
jgi:hypothetical protein